MPTRNLAAYVEQSNNKNTIHSLSARPASDDEPQVKYCFLIVTTVHNHTTQHLLIVSEEASEVAPEHDEKSVISLIHGLLPQNCSAKAHSQVGLPLCENSSLSTTVISKHPSCRRTSHVAACQSIRSTKRSTCLLSPTWAAACLPA